MMQNVLRAIGGIENYGVISVVLFFAVFIAAVIRACVQKKPFLNHMSALPLDDGETTPSAKGEKLS